MNITDIDRLRKLAISWRWWAATKCTASGDERTSWLAAARELEKFVGLDPPPQRVVMAPNSTPTHRCPICGSPYWWCDGPPSQCSGRRIPLGLPGFDDVKDFMHVDVHDPTTPVAIEDGAELAPWNPIVVPVDRRLPGDAPGARPGQPRVHRAPSERPQARSHEHGHGCSRDSEGPTIMWLCGYEPYSTPKRMT